jgi:hypothetical protein
MDTNTKSALGFLVNDHNLPASLRAQLDNLDISPKNAISYKEDGRGS